MKLIIASLIFLVSCNSTANTTSVGTLVLPEGARKIEIYGEIDGSLIEEAGKLRAYASKSNEDVYLLINSPGGSVIPGMIFIDAMKAAQSRGVKLRCVTTVLAASMAYIIYSQCDTRYAFENARLLFHPMSLSGRFRAQELLPELVQLNKEEADIMEKLRTDLNMDYKVFHSNYFAETFWQAKRLQEASPKFLTIITDVEGFKTNIYLFEKPRSIFDQMSETVIIILNRFKGINYDNESNTECGNATSGTQQRQRSQSNN